MKYPISVIIPHQKSRSLFFSRFCLPSVEANSPKEIIIEDCEGSAPYKRNLGASKASQDFLFFCDDDTILAKNCFEKMYAALDGSSHTFAYSHYSGIVMNQEAHPIGKNFVFQSQSFDLKRLKQSNFIDTMSLLKAESFPGFDEELLGFQDWDLWLTMIKNGASGCLVDDLLFMKFYFDSGISSNLKKHMDAKEVVKKKHYL